MPQPQNSTPSQVARDISYASSARSRPGRAFIRVMENATGRLSLIRRAAGYETEVAKGRNFWEVMAERYGLSLDVVGGSLSNIPQTGPVIVIANHPYGILDGLMMGNILSRRRTEYRILANQVFRRAAELEKVILPVNFEESKAAQVENLESRRQALQFLSAGGAMGIFPGGTVSTAPKPFGQPMDPAWRTFTGKLVTKSGATVVPVFFDGANSRLFQIASHLHLTLRLALLISEFKARVDEPVRVVIGEPIPPERMAPHRGDPRALMDYLRDETYRLSPRPLASLGYGYEFEPRYRTGKAR